MSVYAKHYHSGERIHAGDIISFTGVRGRILFVLGVNDPLPEDIRKEEFDWFNEKYAEGFLIETDLTGRIFETESNEDLSFISRA
ncbi:MAG TPA: hypothetical protein VGN88_13865 [Phycisphaerae bacterium]